MYIVLVLFQGSGVREESGGVFCWDWEGVEMVEKGVRNGLEKSIPILVFFCRMHFPFSYELCTYFPKY
jgi:hypothetical protein